MWNLGKIIQRLQSLHHGLYGGGCLPWFYKLYPESLTSCEITKVALKSMGFTNHKHLDAMLTFSESRTQLFFLTMTLMQKPGQKELTHPRDEQRAWTYILFFEEQFLSMCFTLGSHSSVWVPLSSKIASSAWKLKKKVFMKNLGFCVRQDDSDYKVGHHQAQWRYSISGTPKQKERTDIHKYILTWIS